MSLSTLYQNHQKHPTSLKTSPKTSNISQNITKSHKSHRGRGHNNNMEEAFEVLQLSNLTRRRKDVAKKNRRGNRIRNRSHALHEMDSIDDKMFKKMFRMSRHAFTNLLDILEERFEERDARSVRQAQNSSGSVISSKTALAVTLRWLAGASYIDLCFSWGISMGSFYADDGVLWGTMDAINEAFDIGLPLTDSRELSKIAREYSYYSYGHITNVVSAIDGWVCRTRCPTYDEVMFPAHYRNRKGFFGIVVIAGCDSNLRFNIFSSKCSGATHDSLAWEVAAAKHLIIDEKKLPAQFVVIGDEAFVTSDQLWTPWSGHSLDEWKDAFNYYLSAMRQCIERAFALLTQKWGVFWRPLRCAHDRWPLVCMVAAKLHNYCIDMEEDQNDMERFEEDVEDGDVHCLNFNQYLNSVSLEERRPSGDSRRRMTKYFETHGVRRVKARRY